MKSLANTRPGSALFLSAGDPESFRESGTLASGQESEIAAQLDKSSLPQNAPTSTLQACAART